MSREYCQNGLRSGVDSTTGNRAGGVWYAEAELMNTYCPVRPPKQPDIGPHVLRREGDPVDHGVELATADGLPDRGRVAGIAAQHPDLPGHRPVPLVPRLSTNNSIPRSTASHEHAELMTPLPPMNSTLSPVTHPH